MANVITFKLYSRWYGTRKVSGRTVCFVFQVWFRLTVDLRFTPWCFLNVRLFRQVAVLFWRFFNAFVFIFLLHQHSRNQLLQTTERKHARKQVTQRSFGVISYRAETEKWKRINYGTSLEDGYDINRWPQARQGGHPPSRPTAGQKTQARGLTSCTPRTLRSPWSHCSPQNAPCRTLLFWSEIQLLDQLSKVHNVMMPVAARGCLMQAYKDWWQHAREPCRRVWCLADTAR